MSLALVARNWWLAAMIHLAAVSAACAAGDKQVRQHGDVLAGIQVDCLEVPLSREVRLVVSIEGPAPLEVESIPRITTSPAWRVRRVTEPESSPSPGNRVRWQQTYCLEPLQAKEVSLPIAPLRFRTGPAAEKWQEVTWEPIPIQVTTEVTAAALSELREPTGIEGIPPAPDGLTLWLWAFAAAVAIVGSLALAAWFYLRRPGKETPPVPPHERALGELAQIEATVQPTNGEMERYHTAIADVVRRYLESRFGLRALEQTTNEFMGALQHSSPLVRTHQELLKELLERCDQAKFARASFTAEECAAARRLALSFIKQTAEEPS